MKRSPMKQRYRVTGPDLGTVLRVLERDGHACVRDGTPIRGERGRDWVLHHRRPRAMGGSQREDTNSPANLLSLCTACHLEIESSRAQAREAGWLLWQNADPQACAVLVDQQRRWVYLTDAAEYVDAPAVTA